MATETTAFDPALIEDTVVTSCSLVDVYKIGGGTLGHRYDGLWGYRVRRHGKVVVSGEDLRTGTPKTHDEAAEEACSFATHFLEAGERSR